MPSVSLIITTTATLFVITQVVSNSFAPSNQDSYGSPVSGVITNPRGNAGAVSDDVANVPVGSSLSFGSSSSLDSGLRSQPSSGFNPITTSTFDQGSANLPKRNVFGTATGQVISMT